VTRLTRAVAAVLLVLVLSGCVDVTLRFGVTGGKDTISGSAIVAVERGSLIGIGGIDGLAGGDDPIARRPAHGNLEIRDYENGSLVGKEYRYDAVPLADFGAASGLRITHENRRYVLDGTVDLTGGGIRGTAGTVTKTAKATLALDFPGTVLAANGKINGKSVTWTLTFGRSNTVTAEADDGQPPPRAATPGRTGSGGGGFPAWLAAVLGAVAVALVVVVVWLVRRPPRAGPAAAELDAGQPRDTLPLPRMEAPDSLLRDPRWSEPGGQ
jgi:hypothetical protein